MHVSAHSLTAFEQFPRTETSFNCESFIEFDKRFNPWIDEEIVANCYLASRGEMVLVQHQVENSTIKDNISMIAYESVTFRTWRYSTIGEGITCAAFAQDASQNRLDEAQLELQRRVDANKRQTYQAVSHPAWHPRHKAFQQSRELPVGKKTLDGLLYLTLREGTDFVESPLPAPPWGECFRLRVTHGQSDINY
jgi:hypothetical protein